MKRCINCNKVGFWFQFFSSFEGLYIWTPDYCKECAKKITREAVSKEVERLTNNK